MALAVAALVAIGTVEAAASAGQLADLPGRGRPALGPGGAALTLVGFVLSVAVFAALGWVVAQFSLDEGAALRGGAVVGVFAWLALPSREPEYQGKSLSYWLDTVYGVQAGADREQAVRSIGTKNSPANKSRIEFSAPFTTRTSPSSPIPPAGCSTAASPIRSISTP